MNKFNKRTVGFAFLLCFVSAISVSHAGSKKVYVVKGDSLIGWAMGQGHKMKAKQLDSFGTCQMSANHLKVKRNNVSYVDYQEPSCLFTFFKSGKLANGWKVKGVKLLSEGSGNWHYMIKPHGKNSLLMMINAKKTGGRVSDLKLELKSVTLIGPANSTSWKQAIQRSR